MKNNWIKLSEKMPALNEIIYYKGNPHGNGARHIGNGNVQLPNGVFDKFDEWKPRYPGHVTFNILHVDGVTKIEAKGIFEDGIFTTEYSHKGMCYGAAIPLGRIK